MDREDSRHQPYALRRRHIRQPEEPGVTSLLGIDELPKVLVEGNEDPAFTSSPSQKLAIARIFAQLTSLNHVVASVSKPSCQRAAHATVDEEFHPDDARIASNVSSAITARA